MKKTFIFIAIFFLLLSSTANAQGLLKSLMGSSEKARQNNVVKRDRYGRVIEEDKDVPPQENVKVVKQYSVGDYVPTQDSSGKWGFKQFGEWVVDPRFDSACDFNDGLAPVFLNGKWGYIDKKGTCIIPYKYEYAGAFHEGLARVKMSEKWGYVDPSGKCIIPYKYNFANDFSNGLAQVNLTGKNGYIDKTDRWFDTADEVMQSFSSFARHRIEADINQWQKKGKYEKLAQWQTRVTDKNRKERIDSLVNDAKIAFIASESKKIKQNYDIVDYDSESEVFLIHDANFGNLLVPVPIQNAEQFENAFKGKDLQRKDIYCVNGEGLGLKEALFYMSDGHTYKYNNEASLTFASIDIDYNFEAVSFEDAPLQTPTGTQTIASKNMKYGSSDVDQRIPETHFVNSNTFALIITNENYSFVSPVPFANNDGKAFEEYCRKTLGLPKENIHRAQDATYGKMIGEMDWIASIAKAYKGDARLLVYYAGHGIPDESSRDAFLLPVDGTGSNTSTAIKLSNVYSKLNENPTASTVVFLDACFSGAQRNGQMLAQARGVAIKAKTARPEGNIVVFSAASGDETAYPYKDKGHGLFSYYLLKKIQESRGEVTLNELAAYLEEKVSQQSIIQNSKSQTPSVIPSNDMGEKWKELKLK